MNDSISPVRVPARDIPVPGSVGPEAQAVLARGMVGPRMDWPADEGDAAAWKELVARLDRKARELIESAGLVLDEESDSFMGCQMRNIESDGVTIYEATPPGTDVDDERLYFYLHGGAWQQGGGVLARFMAALTALTTGARTWSTDYRMPPEHPFPAPIQDCFDAYRRALEDHSPENIVVAGVSAGANLSAGLMHKLRDEGVPLPAAVVLDTPAIDLTESGDTWWTNFGVDPTLTSQIGPAIRVYAGGADLRHPYLSPLFGDLGPWYPPTVLLTGTRDLMLSDTVRFHRALLGAGAVAELHVFEAQGHSGFLGQAPEDHERSAMARTWAQKHWAASEGDHA